MADEKKIDEKKVKIKVLRPIRIGDRVVDPTQNGLDPKTNLLKDVIVEVTEEDAKMFCDVQYKGHYAFAGERYSGSDPTPEDVKAKKWPSKFLAMDDPNRPVHDYRRAVRI